MPKTTRRVRVVLGERLQPVGELVFEADGRRQAGMFRYADEWLSAAEGFAIAPTLPLSESAPSTRRRRGSVPVRRCWGRSRTARRIPGGAGCCARRSLAPSPSSTICLRWTTRLARARCGTSTTTAGRCRAPTRRCPGCATSTRCGAWPAPPRTTRTGRRRFETFWWAAPALSAGPGPRPTCAIGAAASPSRSSPRTVTPCRWSGSRWRRWPLPGPPAVNAAQARIELGSTDRPVALIKRFDRAGGDRVHYLSAQSFIGAEAATGAYYTDIADALRAHAFDPTEQLTELYRRVLFTILVSNNDEPPEESRPAPCGRGTLGALAGLRRQSATAPPTSPRDGHQRAQRARRLHRGGGGCRALLRHRARRRGRDAVGHGVDHRRTVADVLPGGRDDGAGGRALRARVRPRREPYRPAG